MRRELTEGEIGRQREFKNEYITTKEIEERLGVTRPTVLNARLSGQLPKAIPVFDSHTFLWKRTDIEEYIRAWELILQAKRVKKNAHNQ